MLGSEFEGFLEKCTPRQQQVARLLIAGNKTAEIAQVLGISQCRILQIKHDLADRYTKVESETAGEIRFRKVVRKYSIR